MARLAEKREMVSSDDLVRYWCLLPSLVPHASISKNVDCDLLATQNEKVARVFKRWAL